MVTRFLKPSVSDTIVFSLLRAAGILLILLGMTWVEKEKHAPAESEE